MSDILIEVTNDEEFRKRQTERLLAYQRFFNLITEKGITPYKVHKDTGIATATLSDWKNGKSTPKQDKMKLLADYLGVSTDYLVSGEERRYSEDDALLDVRISEDKELKEAIKKYYALDDRKKRHVIELINLLSEA